MDLTIKVDSQAREYFMSMKNVETGLGYWEKCAGHLITVGKFEFVAAPYISGNLPRINVFEKSSGSKLLDITEPFLLFFTSTLEETIKYFETHVGPGIAKIISNLGIEMFEREIKEYFEKSRALCGEMPEGEAVDVLGEKI